MLSKLYLYDDGEQEPFLVFEAANGQKACFYISSLVQESLSKEALDTLKAIEKVTES